MSLVTFIFACSNREKEIEAEMTKLTDENSIIVMEMEMEAAKDNGGKAIGLSMKLDKNSKKLDKLIKELETLK